MEDFLLPESIRMKIGRAGYIQRVGDKDYLKNRSRIESVPLRKLVRLNRMGGRNWRLIQEGKDFFLILEALTWEEEEKAVQKAKYP
jgi:hypothetical protein